MVEGRRPRFPSIKSGSEALQSVQKEYTKLAEYCWDKTAEKRPSFDDVVSVLFISLQELKRRVSEDAGKEAEDSSASEELKNDTSNDYKAASEIKVRDVSVSSLAESEEDRTKRRGTLLDVTPPLPPLPTGSARLVMKYGAQEAKFRVAASSTFAALVAECKKKFKIADSVSELEMQDAEGYIVVASDIIGLVFPNFEKEPILLRIMP